MKVIALDVMGVDLGVIAAVEAAKRFVEKYPDFEIILVGDQAQILEAAGSEGLTKGLSIHHITKVVPKTTSALATRDFDNSMGAAISLVAENKAQAVLSGGNSAAYITYTTLILKRLNGVKRPAFMPLIPSLELGRRFVMLDVGANLEVTAEMLVQWAKMGAIFAKTILKITNPTVGILNIGTEDDKGFPPHQEANLILKKSKDFKYVGFVESRDLIKPLVDVVVADGYAGNIFLKSFEGVSLNIFALLKMYLMKRVITKIGALFAKSAFTKIRQTFDYRNIGGAYVIGVNGIAIKCHGSSDAQAFYSSLLIIRDSINYNLVEAFTKALNDES